ncbi:MAG: ABC transporter permease [Leptospira sp.]|nr:ABC transporter permease [Leptospira sp.]
MIPTIFRIINQIRRSPLNTILSLCTTPFVLIAFHIATKYSIDNNTNLDLQIFIPRLVILSLVMSIFPVAMAITEELESQCNLHMRMAGMNSGQILLGLAIPYYFIGFISSVMSIIVALLIGLKIYNYQLLVGVIFLGLIPLVGIGVLIGAISRNSLQSFFLSSLIMFLMIVFSGLLFPAPSIKLFSILEQSVDLFFFLPTASIQYLFMECFGSSESIFFRDLVFHILILILLSVIYIGLAFAIYEKNEAYFLENSI